MDQLVRPTSDRKRKALRFVANDPFSRAGANSQIQEKKKKKKKKKKKQKKGGHHPESTDD
ncbi:hypothetical protein [Candidatus Skiveiella danica]|uniref:hypothetical protein n=1 Tax=Candidatus Skiveiella danica TaxID=3386177 RepID=UPI001D6D35E8|nr:hypothetical protein [Betaproteobacteria bacterium]